MADIFISYKREEQPVAKKLADALENHGWSVWWDPKLRTGEHFDDVIEAALEDAKCAIVMWSKRSTTSRFIKDEATYALNEGKLIPVQIEDAELPFRFANLHTARLVDWDGSPAAPAFRKFVADLEQILETPPATVAEQNKAEVSREAKPRQEAERQRHARSRVLWIATSVVVLVGLGMWLLVAPNILNPGYNVANVVDSEFRHTLWDRSRGPAMVVIPAANL